MRASTALIVALCGCAGSVGAELERHKLGDLEYGVPEQWQSIDQSEHQTKIIVWRPADNSSKESIAVMRTRALPAIASSEDHLSQFLADAQTRLPQARFAPVALVKTARGLTGVRVEGDFVPDGVTDSYHRIHAVVVDGTSLVHVLYTAREPNRETFNVVLDSLMRKAG